VDLPTFGRPTIPQESGILDSPRVRPLALLALAAS